MTEWGSNQNIIISRELLEINNEGYDSWECSDEKYQVEDILMEHKVQYGGKEFLIKWRGFDQTI